MIFGALKWVLLFSGSAVGYSPCCVNYSYVPGLWIFVHGLICYMNTYSIFPGPRPLVNLLFFLFTVVIVNALKDYVFSSPDYADFFRNFFPGRSQRSRGEPGGAGPLPWSAEFLLP